MKLWSCMKYLRKVAWTVAKKVVRSNVKVACSYVKLHEAMFFKEINSNNHKRLSKVGWVEMKSFNFEMKHLQKGNVNEKSLIKLVKIFGKIWY